MIYNINDIILKIDLLASSPLEKDLLAYKIDGSDYNHYISINVLENINTNIKFSKVSPFIVIEDKLIYKYYYTKKSVTAVIEHDKDYKNINISLNKTFIKDLYDAEYVFLGITFMEIAMLHHFLAIHASALLYKDKAFLLSAPSKTGKSTLRSHLLNLDKNITIINDDKPLLEFREDICVFGSPFSGEARLNTNIKRKLNHIFFLAQGASNKKYSLTKEEATKHLLKNIYKPKEDFLWDTVLKQIKRLTEEVDITYVEVVNDISAANFIINIMEEL